MIKGDMLTIKTETRHAMLRDSSWGNEVLGLLFLGLLGVVVGLSIWW